MGLARQAEGNALHIALLRGINVGGKNRVRMAQLAALFGDLGCRQIQTYIQSGNVLFAADDDLARSLPDLIAAHSAARFGFSVPVVTRTVAELEAVARNNPFLEQGADPNTLHVAFLRDQPSPSHIASLDPDRSPPDEFAVVGREIYLCLPNGAARSKLTNQYVDSKLKTTSTVRNWRTVLKLLDLAHGG